MKRLLFSICIALAGCSTTTAPAGYWYRDSDGLRVDANETTMAAFNKDRAICDGKAAQAAIDRSVNVSGYNDRLINLIFDGCLNERGYTRKP
ncbi:hypothetical protein FJU08_01385 [Martelella alba]|uniref:Lipoprotein n=1 Tax=Martelella alba TaxID=2590451 RepID=A0A506UIT8_9HYPH|nr:hypothetical protein [Martelella alba]TPW33245.1 hypothetical protein FJU08_01385 [Martelella alba]